VGPTISTPGSAEMPTSLRYSVRFPSLFPPPPHFLDANCNYQLDLNAAQLERKIRLLSLADLGFQNIGQDLPYAHVAAVLQVAPSEVERWVIDG
jgi:hypothetical protein